MTGTRLPPLRFRLMGLAMKGIAISRRLAFKVKHLREQQARPGAPSATGSPALVARLAELPRRLAELAAEAQVPGLCVGVISGEDTAFFVHGSASRETGAPVTPETVFQIASNTKVYTATVVMGLVDEGLVDLDAPVIKYVPEFALRHVDAGAVTVRHLLTHTGGFLGDFLGGPDATTLEDFVDELAEAEQLHPVGEMWSYCNSGFVLLGRLIEKVTGQEYDDALRARLLDRIGDSSTRTRLQDMAELPLAAGHWPNPKTKKLEEAPFGIAPICAPAGSVVVSTAPDVLRFLRMHLAHGVAEDGTRVLSEQSVALMQDRHVTTPLMPRRTTGWGLGWAVRRLRNGQLVVGHDGATVGQFSMIEVVPERGIALVVLANAAAAGQIVPKVVDHVLDTLAGSNLAEPLKLPKRSADVDASKYVGQYGDSSVTVDVQAGSRGVFTISMARATVEGLPEMPPMTAPFVPLNATDFAIPIPGVDVLLQFMGLDEHGVPRYLFDGRVHPRLPRQ